jgi:hypothetical protein
VDSWLAVKEGAGSFTVLDKISFFEITTLRHREEKEQRKRRWGGMSGEIAGNVNCLERRGDQSCSRLITWAVSH